MNGHIKKRGDKWRVTIEKGTTAEGKRVRKVMTFLRQEDAKKELVRIQREQSLGLYVEASTDSFGQYLTKWINSRRPNLAPKTFNSYFAEIKNHIIPELGMIPLAQLSSIDLEEYYAKMLETGRCSQRKKVRTRKRKDYDYPETKGLSAKSVQYQHRIIHRALSQAVEKRIIPINVAVFATPPKAEKKEMRYLNRNEVSNLLANIKDEPEYPIIATAIFTGMRQGEILGLRWKDVDFFTGTIHVHQQLQWTKEKGFFFKEPKSVKSKRQIPLPLPLSKTLMNVSKSQDEYRKHYEKENEKVKYNPNDLVFCQPDGSPLEGTALTKRFQKLAAKQNIKNIRFYYIELELERRKPAVNLAQQIAKILEFDTMLILKLQKRSINFPNF